MNSGVMIKNELKRLYTNFQSEMRAVPPPLNRLISRSKKGLTEENAMLCLPFWLLDIFDAPGMLEVARSMALANYYGAACFLAQDRVLDGENTRDRHNLLINNVFYYKWIHTYQRYFDVDSKFWDLFQTYVTEYSNSLYWEKKKHWNRINPFTEDDLIYLGHKFSPTKISCTAMSIISKKDEYIESLSQILDLFHIGFQLRDDYTDWKNDLKSRNFTYLLCALSNEIDSGDPIDDLAEKRIEDALLTGDAAENVLDKSSHYFRLSKELSDELRCPSLSDYLDRMIAKNEDAKNRLRARKEVRARIRHIGPDNNDTLFKRELHEFSYGNEDYVFHVGSSKIFQVDTVSRDVIAASSGSASSDVYSRLQAKYSRDEITETLQELIGEDIIGFEREQIEPFPQSDDRRLKTLSLHITHACNFNCIYCYGRGGDDGTRCMYMTKDVAERAVDMLMNNSDEGDDCNIVLFGGEPLMNFDLMRHTVEYGMKKAEKANSNLRFNTVTNGALLTDDIISYLNEKNIGVQISIDGPPEIQNHNRPLKDSDDSYDAVISGATKLLKSRNGRVSARSTVTTSNMDIIRIVTHLVDLGFKNIHIEPADGKGPGCFVDEEDVERLKGQYTEFSRYYLERIKSAKGFGFSNFLETMLKIHYGRQQHYSCGAGKSYLAVSHNGDIYPCHRFIGDDSRYMGNVFDDMIDGREEFYRCLAENIPSCSGCWARYFCAGGCLWNANLNNNNIFEPDKRKCSLKRHIFDLSMKLYTQLSEEDKIQFQNAYELEGRPYMNDKNI
jgi:uncharacterized protein